MLLICVTNTTDTNSDIPTIIYNLTNTTDDINKKHLIYSSDQNIKLYIFTHIIHTQELTTEILDTIPPNECTHIEFYYEKRSPTSPWTEFFSPYQCDPSTIYNIPNLLTTLNHQQIFSDTMISIYSPSGLVSPEIISKIKYITKERLDTKSYNTIHTLYPDIEPTLSTISEVRELSHTPTPTIITRLKETSHDTAALIVLEYLQHRIICPSVEHQTIYIFTDMWHKDDGHAYTNRLMMYEIPNYTCNSLPNLNKHLSIKDLLKYFNTQREQIITRLCILAESKSFLPLLDDKTNIISTSDGVYDFNTNTFRNPKANDYISISTKTPYLKPNTEEGTQTLLTLLTTFFPNPEILDFFLTTLSLSLGGRNFEKIVVIWVGKTDSGKSTCQEFIEHVLGDYCGSLPSSMLVGKRNNPHGTTSALSAIGKKRLVFIQEPEEVKINSSQLKSLSGNDSIYTREIYEKGSTTKIKAITTIVTNGRMDFSGCDQAALSRLIVIPFTSTFVTSREKHRYKTTKNIKDADNTMVNKLKELSTPMLHILINKYKQYLNTGYTIPNIIRNQIDEFISNCSPALYFMNTCLTQSTDANIQLNILFTYFSSWYKETYPGNKLMPLYQFKETIISSGYEINKDFLIGYAFTS